MGLKVRWTKLWRQRQKDLNLHFPAIKVGPFKKNNTVRKKIVKLKLAQRVFVSLKGLISSEGNLELSFERRIMFRTCLRALTSPLHLQASMFTGNYCLFSNN